MEAYYTPGDLLNYRQGLGNGIKIDKLNSDLSDISSSLVEIQASLSANQIIESLDKRSPMERYAESQQTNIRIYAIITLIN